MVMFLYLSVSRNTGKSRHTGISPYSLDVILIYRTLLTSSGNFSGTSRLFIMLVFII